MAHSGVISGDNLEHSEKRLIKPDLKNIFWCTIDGEVKFLHEFERGYIPIEAEIVPTVDVMTNKVESILIASPDRARSFIEMESGWNMEQYREEIKKCQINDNLQQDLESFMLGYLEKERKTVRCMFLKDEEMKDLKNNQFTKIRSAEMYAIDYGVVRRVKSLFLKPLKVSERMSPFGLQAKLYDENWEPMSLENCDAGGFRHFCVTNRHKILLKEIKYDDHGIPTAHIRVLPPDSFPAFEACPGPEKPVPEGHSYSYPQKWPLRIPIRSEPHKGNYYECLRLAILKRDVQIRERYARTRGDCFM